MIHVNEPVQKRLTNSFKSMQQHFFFLRFKKTWLFVSF